MPKIIPLFIYFLSSMQLAKPNNKMPKDLHIIGHIHKGCPENSKCSSKEGEKIHQWSEILKTNKPNKISSFLKKIGIPVDIWALRPAEKNSSFIIWDGRCENHSKKGQEIRLAQVFSKNLGALAKRHESEKSIVVNRLIIQVAPKKLQTYFIPRGNQPIKYKNKKLYFNHETNGHFYSFSIDPRGKLAITNEKEQEFLPSSIPCPESLISSFKKLNYPPNLFKSHYCKNIWNENLKKYVPIILGWSCF